MGDSPPGPPRCVDFLQTGRLSELADALAGRIMAQKRRPQVAPSRRLGYVTAKILGAEFFFMGNLAKPDALCIAQKHARLVAKSQEGCHVWTSKGKGGDRAEDCNTPWKGKEKGEENDCEEEVENEVNGKIEMRFLRGAVILWLDDYGPALGSPSGIGGENIGKIMAMGGMLWQILRTN